MADKGKHVIHVGAMQVRTRNVAAVPSHNAKKTQHPVPEDTAPISFAERLLRDCALCTAAMLCILGLGNTDQPVAAITAQRLSEVTTTDFQSDEILGRLQFVHNLLPESVQVFWSDPTPVQSISAPSDAQVIHTWAQDEPWIGYESTKAVFACEAGEVMSVTPMDDGTYALRIRHDNELESIYSQLSDCCVKEGDLLEKGEQIGSAEETLLFEVRQQGKMMNPADLMRTP